MAQCKQTSQDFIQSTFSPQVAVLCSSDAELVCQKNNLSFVQLVQPFCRLTTEAHIRDANNAPHTLHNLRIGMVDMNSHPPPAAAARKIMNDAVNNAQLQISEGNRGNVMSVGNYDLQLSATTPWFEAYRECFLQMLPSSDHEFLKHCLGCIFVVSSNHTDPLAVFSTLASSQQQQQTQFPNKLPRWFCHNVSKYYLLLHDVVEVEQAKADAIYASMKSSFGHQSCHLLQINSRSLTTAENMKVDANLPDPWSQFLSRQQDTTRRPQKARYFIAWEGVDYDVSGSSGVEDSAFPSKLVEGAPPDSSNDLVALDHVSEATEGGDVSVTTMSEVIDHPLALSDQSPVETNNVSDMNNDHLGSSYSLNSDTGQGVTKSTSFVLEKPKPQGHGLCLTTSDQDRIRIFIHEFAVRALIPWAERQMKYLNEQLTSRTGIRRTILGATKKWFGGNRPASQVASNQETTVVYSKDAPELQMRRLADLAFLFQLYDFAYQTYHTAKRDFNNDHAWLHYAGALEMACIAIFMQGNQSQRPYPYHYMESAITTYLQSCKNPHYAVRATLVSSEALKSRGMYTEAAMQFIKMMSEDSDLRSALLLEQAAHCFINMKNPMVRKYSFHMILAGHRFSKSGQRKHALRAYSQALQIYKGKNWSLAEDHINFTIGRQSHNLKQLENATAAFKHLLTENSKQTATQQNAYLREYLFVYRQLLLQETEETGLQSGVLPELPLPALDSNATKVILISKPQPPQGDKVFATGVWFDHPETSNSKWQKLEDILVASANNGSLPTVYRPTLQCYSSRTDNKFSPVGFVREPITVEIYLVNPLKVTLTLTDVSLLWSFVPLVASHDKPQTVTNEQLASAKNNLADEIIHGQVLSEIVLQGNDRLPVQLTLIPQQLGDLRITGLAYNLGSTSPTFMAPSQGPGGGLLGGSVGPKASFVSTVYVRGKQRLEVQGPRLNGKKDEMVNKMYGPDRRLDLVIQHEMPLLQVSFSSFPRKLLCGEVHPVSLHFCNLGTSPLHKLKVASSNPKFFWLGTGGELPRLSGVYHTERSASVSQCSSSVNVNTECGNLSRVLDINIPGGTLHPNSTVTVPAWVRGNDIGGIHEVDFLFYYEPAQQMSKVRHRTLRHTVLVNMLESLSVRAVAQRACKGTSDTSHVRDCIVSCEMENLSQAQYQKSLVKEIQVTQLSCASQHWAVRCLSTHTTTDIRIGSREILQVCLKAETLSDRSDPVQSDDSSAKSITFSDISFNSERIQSWKSPCSDFYRFSQVQVRALEDEVSQEMTSSQIAAKPKPNVADFSPLSCAIELGMTLIILWQAHVVDENGEDSVCLGQHHVTIEKVDTIFTSYPFTLVPTERPPVRFIRDDTQPEDVKPPSEVITQLVSYKLQHQTDISHGFSKCRVCCVPVTLLLENCSDSSVTVLVDTSRAQQRLTDYQETSPAIEFSTNGFSWVGQTLTEFQLSEREHRSIPLTACFGKPGIFNVNNLAVFVAYREEAAEMTLQKTTKPSVVVVNNVC